MRKWEYLRLTVAYGADGRVHTAISNETVILSPSDNVDWKDLQNHIMSLGDQGWELVTVFEDDLMNETFDFKCGVA